MVNSIIPDRLVYNKIAEENAFLVNSFVSIPADGSANVHLKNPHPDKVMWIVGVQIQATGSHEFYLHDEFNSITTGDEIQIQNAYTDEENDEIDSGPFEAYTDSTYDAKTSYPIGFTEADKKTGASGSMTAEAVDPNREVVIEFRNQEQSAHKGFFGALTLSSY